MCNSNFSDIYFDLDGTLLDTLGDIRTSMCTALEICESSKKLFEQNFRVGPPLFDIVRMCLPEGNEVLAEKVTERFREAYDKSSYPQTQPYEGIPELLQMLKSAGKRLFLATNKRFVPTLKLVEHFRWNEFFTDIFTPDCRPERLSKAQMILLGLEKWRGDPNASILVGDTSTDITGGKTAGIQTVAVEWGYANTEELVLCIPDFQVHNTSELRNLLLN